MGGTEVTELERIQRAMNRAEEGTASAAANATRGSGLFEPYQNPSDVGTLSTTKNPYGSVDDLANSPDARVDLKLYKLNGPEGLAEKLLADLPTGIIEPAFLRRYITTNLDLNNPTESRLELLAALARLDPSVRTMIQKCYENHSSELTEAEKKGTHELEMLKRGLLETVLYEKLIDMHQQGLTARSNTPSRRAEGMGEIIERYFSPDARIDTSTNPAEKAQAILIGLNNPDLSHEQRQLRIQNSLEMLSDMPELRAEVRAELRRYQDMASTSAQELHNALQSEDPTTALAAVLIGKSRGQNGGLDEIQLVLNTYKEKFPGRDFEVELSKAHTAGKLDDEQYQMLNKLLKQGFNPLAIAEDLRTEMDSIRPDGIMGSSWTDKGQIGIALLAMGAAFHMPGRPARLQGKVAEMMKGGMTEEAALATPEGKKLTAASKPGMLNSFTRNPALIGGLGLAAIYGAEQLEQYHNSDSYKRVTTILAGLSSEQMQQVQAAYAGSGLIDSLQSSPENKSRLVDLNFLSAGREGTLSAEQSQQIARSLVDQMRTAENPDQIAAMLVNTFGSLDKVSGGDIISRASIYIQDGFLQPVMEPSGQMDAEGKPILQVKKNSDGSPVMAVQIPEGQAANFKELVEQSISNASPGLYDMTQVSMQQGFNAERLASQALVVVNQMNAFRAPDSATLEQKQDFEAVLSDLTRSLNATQLKEFQEAWQRQISNRTQLGEDISTCVKNAKVHSEMSFLLAGNNRLWHGDRSNYMHAGSKENPLVTLGIRSGQQDILAHVDNLEKALRENNPGASARAIEGMSDAQLSSIDELIDAFHGDFDTKTLERHLDRNHRTAVELGFNPYKRQAELESLIESGSAAQISTYLETLAGPVDQITNPQQGQKLALFFENYGTLHLVEQLRERHPEALTSIVSDSQNRALQLALKPKIDSEIVAVLADSSRPLEQRAKIAETFYGSELVANGIRETQYITDALATADIVSSGTFTPEQSQTLLALADKNAASNQQIVGAYSVLMQGNPAMSDQLFELTVPIRYELLRNRLEGLGMDFSIDGVQPLSDVVRSGADRGHMELVYNFSGTRQKFVVDHALMGRLEGLEQALRQSIEKNPETAEESRGKARDFFKAVLTK